jgi:hypothetical protein
MWGLPAISFKPPESPEDAVKRLGLEKLGCLIEPYSFLGAFYKMGAQKTQCFSSGMNEQSLNSYRSKNIPKVKEKI